MLPAKKPYKNYLSPPNLEARLTLSNASEVVGTGSLSEDRVDIEAVTLLSLNGTISFLTLSNSQIGALSDCAEIFFEGWTFVGGLSRKIRVRCRVSSVLINMAPDNIRTVECTVRATGRPESLELS